MIECRDCFLGYSQKPVLTHVSLLVDEGQSVGIIGANGSGKSTLLRGIAGYALCFQGQIFFNGDSIEHLDPVSRRALGMAYVPQGGIVFRSLTGIEQLKLAAKPHFTGTEFQMRLRWIKDILPGIDRIAVKLGRQLSGGEKTWLALACALIGKPRLILLDEPSLGLSVSNRNRLFTLIKEKFGIGCSVLVAEQRVTEVKYVIDSVLDVGNGTVKKVPQSNGYA